MPPRLLFIRIRPFVPSHATLRTHPIVEIPLSLIANPSSKLASGLRNQCRSRSTLSIREPESNLATTSTSRHKFRSPSLSSLEDEAESSVPSTPPSMSITPTLITQSPSPSPFYAVTHSPPLYDGVSEPLATMEILIADTLSVRPA